MALGPTDYREFFYRAIAAEVGVLIETSDREKLIARLKTEQQANPEFKQVTLLRHPTNENQFYMVRKNGEAQGE